MRDNCPVGRQCASFPEEKCTKYAQKQLCSEQESICAEEIESCVEEENECIEEVQIYCIKVLQKAKA